MQEEQVYRVRKGWRIFICSVSLIMAALAVWAGVEFVRDGDWMQLGLLSFPTAVFAVLGWLHMLKGRIVVGKDAVHRVSVFRRSIPYTEIMRIDLEENMAVVKSDRSRIELNRDFENWREAMSEIRHRWKEAVLAEERRRVASAST